MRRMLRKGGFSVAIVVASLAGCTDNSVAPSLAPRKVPVESIRVSYDLKANATSTDTSRATIGSSELLAVPILRSDVGDEVPASEQANQGFLLEFTSPYDGTTNYVGLQFNSTGDGIKSMTLFRGNEKLWVARMQWVPSGDLMVATNIIQDLYVNDAVVEELTGNYDIASGATVPRPLLYAIPYSQMLPSSFASAHFFSARLAVSPAGGSSCTLDVGRWIAEQGAEKATAAAIRKAGGPDVPLTPADVNRMATAMRCAIELYQSSVLRLNSAGLQQAMVSGTVTAVIAAGWISDRLGRMVSPTDIFSNYKCLFIANSKECEWVGGRMTQ